MRNVVVIDANIALKWVIDEPDSNIAEALLTMWGNKKIVMLAPALLAYEVTNVLYQNVRKGKITINRAREALADVLFIGMELDFFQDPDLGRRAMELAQRFNLPATYDPHYLALAERKGCEFWTADIKLWKAVQGELDWVRWMSDYQPTNPHTSSNESDNS